VEPAILFIRWHQIIPKAEETAELLAQRAHKKGLELACHIKPEVPTFLTGDPTRLRQILVNLAGNAIKFTEEGEVTIQVSLETRQKGGLAQCHQARAERARAKVR